MVLQAQVVGTREELGANCHLTDILAGYWGHRGELVSILPWRAHSWGWGRIRQ